MFIRRFVIVLGILALPVAASAQSGSGSYLSIVGGVTKMQREDVDARLSAEGPSDVGALVISAGPAVAAAVGRAFASGLRVEAEGAFRANHISTEVGLRGVDNDPGTERKVGVMGNAIYDLTGASVRPYVGGGVGVQFVHEPGVVASDGIVTLDVPAQTKSSFAYQAIAGVAFGMGRGWAFLAEYRYLGLAGTRTYTGTATVPGVGSFDLTEKSTDNRNHSVVGGVRYRFGG
jgi:opacity protein-like surface antigen